MGRILANRQRNCINKFSFALAVQRHGARLRRTPITRILSAFTATTLYRAIVSSRDGAMVTRQVSRGTVVSGMVGLLLNARTDSMWISKRRRACELRSSDDDRNRKRAILHGRTTRDDASAVSTSLLRTFCPVFDLLAVSLTINGDGADFRYVDALRS